MSRSHSKDQYAYDDPMMVYSLKHLVEDLLRTVAERDHSKNFWKLLGIHRTTQNHKLFVAINQKLKHVSDTHAMSFEQAGLILQDIQKEIDKTELNFNLASLINKYNTLQKQEAKLDNQAPPSSPQRSPRSSADQKQESSDPYKSFEAALLYLKNEPSEANYLKYVEVANHYRKDKQFLNHLQDNPDLKNKIGENLATAGAKNLEAAKIILSSRLCYFMPPKDAVIFFLTILLSKDADQFKNFVVENDNASTYFKVIVKVAALKLHILGESQLLRALDEAISEKRNPHYRKRDQSPPHNKQQHRKLPEWDTRPEAVRRLKDAKIDPCEFLGVKSDATPEQIKHAYKQKLILMHVDKVEGRLEETDPVKRKAILDEAIELHKLLKPAQDILLDNDLRKYFGLPDLASPKEQSPQEEPKRFTP